MNYLQISNIPNLVLRAIGIEYSFNFLLSLSLLYLAFMNVVAFTLKASGFSYWRLFKNLKYLVVVFSIYVHLKLKIGSIQNNWLTLGFGYLCASFVNLYLVDFAWSVGETYLHKRKHQSTVAEILLIITFSLTMFLAWKFMYIDDKQTISMEFCAYLVLVVLVTLINPASSIISSLVIIIIVILQRYALMQSCSSTASSLITGGTLILALHRQGKQAQVQKMSNGHYPTISYLFFAAIEIYVYNSLEANIKHGQFIVGIIYIISVIKDKIS